MVELIIFCDTFLFRLGKFERRFPHHFFEANQRKVVKIFSWIQCAISTDMTRELYDKIGIVCKIIWFYED